MDDYGFIYFLSNTSMPGIYKIGFTTKHPRLRMAELASSSGCPTPFTLLAYFGAECPQRVESMLHRRFASCRVNGRREFFSVTPADMSRIVDHFAKRFGDAVFRTGLDAVNAGYVEVEPIAIVKKPEPTVEERERNLAFGRERIQELRALVSSFNQGQ